MRTLKFRYWDTKNKKFDTDIGLYLIGGVDLANTLPEGYEITQFTGLTDRQGKEIYEGDIVQLPYITPFGDLGGDGGVDELGEVVFAQGAFMLHMNFEPEPRSMLRMIERNKGEYVSNYGNTTIYSDKTLFEVIGNIWENPELLK